MALTIFRIYDTRWKEFYHPKNGRSIWMTRNGASRRLDLMREVIRSRMEIREYRFIPVDPAECPDCHQMWPENEVILANGELGCSCKL